MPSAQPPTGPFIASIPEALQTHINTLQGGHENCGRISNSLVRLDFVQQCLVETVERHHFSLKAELQRLQQDVQEEQHRLDNSVVQLRDHFVRVQEDIVNTKQRTLDRLSSVTNLLSESHTRAFTSIIDQMKSCTTEFGRDVRSAQTDLLRVESQLVGLNAWSVAWPEAIVAAQNQEQSSPPSRPAAPPQYAFPPEQVPRSQQHAHNVT
ncbi:hypothetical protein CF319_g2022 [Tilletia indica]|uniref:Uncharacterized protein n=1 Tax=Tilletia indica TaxID=43049 RepID=A0A177TB59_9BASI|nr:hypothetical protein CF319_g2022 [Tilletia indica]KAE8246533.1 hypothetical protein A4X13_0g5749 [Tilletia indica]